MTRRFAPLVVFAAVTLFVTVPGLTESNDPVDVTVHEWGTFTSIAADDGGAVEWSPQSGPQDLPCFVDRLRFNTKAGLSGTVRMETPVLYFYAPEETTVKVSVGFRQGLVTEWFPKAAVTPALVEATRLRGPDWQSQIVWKNVTVSPRAPADFPTEQGASHYYAARMTDASPLQSGSQKEKFLFYRGVGRFAPPIRATAGADGRIVVSSSAGEPIGDVILFESRGGTISYQARRTTADRISILQSESKQRDLTGLRRELERILVAQGLYAKEASAMVETWRDSWFEEGARLFYIAPRKSVDAILPLDVSPKPAAVARVFVGRMELITEQTVQDVRDAILAGDRAAFAKYGRFLDPITARVLARGTPAERVTLGERLKSAYAVYYSSLSSGKVCN